jgi:hypothetical protein
MPPHQKRIPEPYINKKDIDKSISQKAKIEFELFEKFWTEYPRQRRGSKKKALAAYKRAVSEKRGTEQEIYEGVLNYAQSNEVANGYAKGAEAWLNDDRWTDDFTIGNYGSGKGWQPRSGQSEPPSRLAAHTEAIRKVAIQQKLGTVWD